MSAIWLCVCFFAADPMFPDVPADLDPKVKAQLLAYAASAEPWRKTEIQIALGQLAAITNSKPKNAEERAAKIEATAKQKELLANLQSGAKFPEPVIDANDPKTGDVGRIVTVFYLHDSVRKVPTKTGGKKNQTTTIFIPGSNAKATVKQILPECVLVSLDGIESQFALKGLNKSDLVDGKEITLPQIWVCTGPKQFETVFGGTKTLFQFEPFEHSEHLNKWERARIEAAKASQKK